jgi:hypothetical protein
MSIQNANKINNFPNYSSITNPCLGCSNHKINKFHSNERILQNAHVLAMQAARAAHEAHVSNIAREFANHIQNYARHVQLIQQTQQGNVPAAHTQDFDSEFSDEPLCSDCSDCSDCQGTLFFLVFIIRRI